MKRIKKLPIFLLGMIAIVMNVQAKKENLLPGISVQSKEYFFTGKPYDNELDGVIFKYRNYDPEFIRWTTSDPSGFPDGINGSIYAPNGLSEIDPLGLEIIRVQGTWIVPFEARVQLSRKNRRRTSAWQKYGEATIEYEAFYNTETHQAGIALTKITPSDPSPIDFTFGGGGAAGIKVMIDFSIEQVIELDKVVSASTPIQDSANEIIGAKIEATVDYSMNVEADVGLQFIVFDGRSRPWNVNVTKFRTKSLTVVIIKDE